MAKTTDLLSLVSPQAASGSISSAQSSAQTILVKVFVFFIKYSSLSGKSVAIPSPREADRILYFVIIAYPEENENCYLLCIFFLL
jgi:hypothetical protein